MNRAFAVLLALGCTVTLYGCDDDPTSPRQGAALARNPTTDAPSALAGASVSETQIDLGWQDNSRNESGFEIYRSTTGSGGTFTSLVRTAANVEAYSDRGLTSATEYCYQVRFFKTQGKSTTVSTFSDVVCIRTRGKPSVPVNVAAVPNAYFTWFLNIWIDVNWTESSGAADGYRVERASVPEGPWEQIAELPGWARTSNDPNRAVEVQACYRVTAYNTYGSSAPSIASCTAPPAAPTGLVATATAAQTIDLTWTDNSAVEDGYEIQRGLDGFSYGPVATVPANATTYRDAGLANGRYYYVVRARKSGGFSGYSGNTSAVVAAIAPARSPSIDVQVSGSTGASIYWTPAPADVSGYRIERSVDGGAWQVAGSVGAFQGAFWETALTSNRRACYRLFAFNGAGDAPQSNEDCVTPIARVADLRAEPAGDGSVDLSWTDPAPALTNGYSIEHLEYYGGGYYGYYAYWRQVDVIGDVQSYRVNGLSPWEAHTFRVVSLGPDGPGTESDEIQSFTEKAPNPPASLTVVAVTSGRVDLRWTDNSNDETAFVVARCNGVGAACLQLGFFDLAVLPANVTDFSDTNVAGGASYTYRIVAYNYVTTSAPSNAVEVTVPASPPE